MEQLAKNLLALRATKKLSREKAAKAVNISSKTYERYEKGERAPTAPLLVEFADFFDVTLDQLAGRASLSDAANEGV